MSDNNKNIYIRVFDTSLNLLGTIDDYMSIRWRRMYNEAGEFEILVLAYIYPMYLFAPDNIIVVDGKEEAAIIENLKIDDNGTESTINVSGRMLSSILERRIIKSRINFTGTIVNGMKALVNAMTPFPNLQVSTASVPSANIIFQVTYKNVYDHLVKLSLISGIAFRILPDLINKKFIFEVYSGLDRTAKQSINERYTFSTGHDNLYKSEYMNSMRTEKNYALIGGQGEGAARVLVTISRGGKTGFDLRETFVDAKDMEQGDATLPEYRSQLAQRGQEALTVEMEQLEADVNAIDYRVKWNLGDYVNVVYEEWGISTEEQITEVEEIHEGVSYQVIPTFGTKTQDIDLSDE